MYELYIDISLVYSVYMQDTTTTSTKEKLTEVSAKYILHINWSFSLLSVGSRADALYSCWTEEGGPANVV